MELAVLALATDHSCYGWRRNAEIGAGLEHPMLEVPLETAGMLVLPGSMFEDDSGPYLRLGFAKSGFADKLSAWAETFDSVRLPGR